MPYTAPTVNYATTVDGTYTTLTGVQSVTINRGRRRLQDPFPSTTMTVELIPANSYATPLAVGQFIDVRQTNSSSAVCYFNGKITDIERSYGMPYNSGTGAAPADRIVITAMGATGLVGLNTVTNYSWPAGYAGLTAAQLSLDVGILTVATTYSYPAENSAQTFTGAALDAINTLCVTGQTYFNDVNQQRSSFYTSQPTAVINYAGYESIGFTFRDTAGTGFKFNAIEYLSSVQNTFTQVQINAEGLASQSASTGSAPFNTLVQSTYNKTTGDAASLASYLLALNQQTTPVPYVVRSSTSADSAIMEMADLNKHLLGDFGTVIFRGSSATCTLEGLSAVFYPDYGAVTCYLAPSLGQPFTLDSTSNGVLDTNRLGYP